MRIGVFYDGPWLGRVLEWLAASRPGEKLPGAADFTAAARWHMHVLSGEPLGECRVTEAHLAQCGAPPAATARAMEADGVRVHPLPGNLLARRKGADVLLALETWDAAVRGALQAAVLITGDAHQAPLAIRMRKRGILPVVPLADARYPGPDGAPQVLRTSPALRAAASSIPDMAAMLDAARENRQALEADSGVQQAREPGSRTGIVVRWRPGEAYGFIRDGSGRGWFAGRDQLPPGLASLPEATPVTFDGSPVAEQGQRCPRALGIRVAG